MGLRIASIDDAALVFAMAEKFIATTPYNKYKDILVIENLIKEIINSDHSSNVIILYDNIGMLAAITSPFIFGLHKSATELAWWVEPAHRKTNVGKELIEAFELWAKTVGCNTVTMVSLDDSIGKYYEKNGYMLCERAYLKEI